MGKGKNKKYEDNFDAKYSIPKEDFLKKCKIDVIEKEWNSFVGNSVEKKSFEELKSVFEVVDIFRRVYAEKIGAEIEKNRHDIDDLRNKYERFCAKSDEFLEEKKSTFAAAAMPMYSLVLSYTESVKNDKLPHFHKSCDKDGAARAHIFPVSALSKMAQRNEINFESNESAALKKAAKVKRYDHDKSPAVDLAPCLILPKWLEKEMDGKIKAYAIACSDTGEESENRPKDNSTSAINEASEFATQHPDAYLQIFEKLLIDYCEDKSLTEEEKKFLLDNFSNGRDRVVEVSEACYENLDEGLFAVSKVRLSRTKSHEEGLKNHRTVLSESAPSLEGFEGFCEDKSSPSTSPYSADASRFTIGLQAVAVSSK